AQATVQRMFYCSPVAFNDIKHLARSMPADGLEAQDVVAGHLRRGDCFLAKHTRSRVRESNVRPHAHEICGVVAQPAEIASPQRMSILRLRPSLQPKLSKRRRNAPIQACVS